MGGLTSAVCWQLGFAFHLHNAIADLFLSTKLAFYIHHAVTLVLILSSHMVGYQHIGACVFLVHDIPDVFASLTKGTAPNCCGFSQDLTATVALIPINIPLLTMMSAFSLITTWAVCRLYLLSYVCCFEGAATCQGVS